MEFYKTDMIYVEQHEYGDYSQLIWTVGTMTITLWVKSA